MTGAVAGLRLAWTGVEYKLLLIGETGSGKTSFLNLLCNCALIEELGYAEGSKQLHEFNDLELENPDAREMQSKTRGTKLYCVDVMGMKLGVIDTPGFGDTRGIAEDEKHAKQIVEALKGEEYVNCICLVVNGRESRMSVTLQYVLTEITAILPREVLNNIIVVCTNTDNPLKLNFDTRELKRFFGRDIDQDRVFLIENPYCLLEKAKMQRGRLSHERIAQSLERSFRETRDELSKMSTIVKDFKRVHTHHFATLYEKKQSIERKVLGLLTEYDNHTRLEAQIAIAKKEAEAALHTKRLYTGYQSTQTIKRCVTVPTSRHNTLCGAVNCYSNCHVPCYLNKSMAKERFKDCRCMEGTPHCTECGHHYTLHYHNEVKFEVTNEVKEWVDREMKRKFEEAQTMEERQRILTKRLDDAKRQSQEERKTLSEELLLTIEQFQKLGAHRNYAKLLENQLAVVEHRLKGTTGTVTHDLRRTKEALTKKLQIVQKTLDTPWASDADPLAQKDWACWMLQVLPTATAREIQQAYRKAARSAHPDKDGREDDYFKRIERAREVLLN